MNGAPEMGAKMGRVWSTISSHMTTAVDDDETLNEMDKEYLLRVAHTQVWQVYDLLCRLSDAVTSDVNNLPLQVWWTVDGVQVRNSLCCCFTCGRNFFSQPFECISTSLVPIRVPVLSVFSTVMSESDVNSCFSNLPDVVEPSSSGPLPSSLPRCHGLSLSRSTLQLTRYWPISRSHRGRNAHVISHVSKRSRDLAS